jgi:alpha-beta hydrolase superfamily lysophospholipase
LETFAYPSPADGWRIVAYRWRAPASPRARVVIAHGMAEHARRYDRFAQALTAAGFEVLAADHRAHGATLGPQGFGDFGDAGWDGLVADLGGMIERARGASPSVPIVLFGHSMGAAAAQQLAPEASEEIAALILSGTTLRRTGEEIPPLNSAFEPARTPYDWLSRDTAEVDRYIADPLCGFEGQIVRNGFDRNDPRRTDPVRLARIRGDLPVLVVVGDADPVHRGLAGVRYLESSWRGAGVRHFEVRVYAGGRHELLNEINRDAVTADIIAWIDRTLREQNRE